MTEETFREEQTKFMEEEFESIKEELLEKLYRAFHSGAIPEEWKNESGDHRTTKAVIDAFCRERGYKLLNIQDNNDANNLYLFM